MVRNIFKGLGIALITPFKEDYSVDYESLLRLVEYQLDNGADFLCILATTGETPTLSAEERLKIKDMVVDKVRGRVPILMGCGGYNTAAVVEELKTGDFRGVNGILSICPYYNKPSQEGLYQHFKAISAATKLPIVMYNVPLPSVWRATVRTSLPSRRPAAIWSRSMKSSRTSPATSTSSPVTMP